MSGIIDDNVVVADLRRFSQVLLKERPEDSLLISVDPQFQIPVARTVDDRFIWGTVAICHHLVTSASHQYAQALNDTERAAVLQWIEYRVNRIDRFGVHVQLNNINRIRQTLEELNGHLERKSYLIGNKCTIADLIVSLGLHAILSRMNLLEKEAYPNLGRWFTQVQQNCVGRETQQLPWNPKVVFSKTPL